MIIGILMVLIGGIVLFSCRTLYKRVQTSPEVESNLVKIAELNRGILTRFFKQKIFFLTIFLLVLFLLLWLYLGFNASISLLIGALAAVSVEWVVIGSIVPSKILVSSSKNESSALHNAFEGGGIAGLWISGIAFVGIGALYIAFHSPDSSLSIVGFGFGVSIVALFAAVAGGVFFSSDQDLLLIDSKIDIKEAKKSRVEISPDMGTELFQSYVGAMIGSMVIGAICSPESLIGLTSIKDISDLSSLGWYREWLMATPFILGIFGIISSVISLRWVKITDQVDFSQSIRNALMLSSLIFLLASSGYFIAARIFIGIRFIVWFSAVVGGMLAILIALFSEYFTSGKLVYLIADSSKQKLESNITSGLIVGLIAAASPFIIIGLGILAANYFGGLYGVSLAAVSMLSTVGIFFSVSMVGGIVETATCIVKQEEKDTTKVRLESAGKMATIIGRGFTGASAVIAGVVLFSAYFQSVNIGVIVNLSVLNPKVISGIIIGAGISCAVLGITLYAALSFTKQASIDSADQIKTDSKNYQKIIGFCSKDPLFYSSVGAGLLGIVFPLLFAFIFGSAPFGGILIGGAIVGVVLALVVANAALGWSNALSYIERGFVEGVQPGSEGHNIAIIGDNLGRRLGRITAPVMGVFVKLLPIMALLLATKL